MQKDPPSSTDGPVLSFDVIGRPASYATAGEAAWKQAVRDAATTAGAGFIPGRFGVRLHFRLGDLPHAAGVWDLDNLTKPTLDALDAVLGHRPRAGAPQVDDERVDRIVATRCPADNEPPGVEIAIYVVQRGSDR